MKQLLNKLACYFLLHDYKLLRYIGASAELECLHCKKIFMKEMK